MNIDLAFDELIPLEQQISSLPVYLVAAKKVRNGAYQTKKISIDSIASQLNASLSSIGTAANHMSSEFATAVHDHDIYTSASYVPEISEEADSSRLKNVLNISSFNAAGSLCSSWSISAYVVEDSSDDVYQDVSASLPKLGELKFIGIHDLAKVSCSLDFNDGRFMGWVKADGSQYDLTDFILSDDIANVLSTDSNHHFCVPCLSTFCRMSTSAITTPYVPVAGNNVLPKHSHTLQTRSSSSYISINSTAVSASNDEMNSALSGLLKKDYSNPECKISFTTSTPLKVVPPIAGIHYGKNNESNYAVHLDSYYTIDDQHVTGMPIFSSDGSSAAVSYPTHNLMPAIVYVGLSKSSQLSSYVIRI